jgi:hypothetical protein
MLTRAATIALLALTCAGCQSIDNDRLTIGDHVPPTFLPADQRAAERLTPATGPSLTGVDRGNWGSGQIVVATDGVQHHPRWTAARPAYTKSPRTAGLHPTTETALTIDRANGAEVAEAAAAPFHAATDVIMLIPRMFSHGPGAVRVSPAEAYERAGAADRVAAPMLEPAPAQ